MNHYGKLVNGTLTRSTLPKISTSTEVIYGFSSSHSLPCPSPNSVCLKCFILIRFHLVSFMALLWWDVAVVRSRSQNPRGAAVSHWIANFCWSLKSLWENVLFLVHRQLRGEWKLKRGLQIFFPASSPRRPQIIFLLGDFNYKNKTPMCLHSPTA